jgi:hypothetical protein
MKKQILVTILLFSVLSIFLMHTAEGFISIKKYKVINSPKVCGDKLCSKIDEIRAKKGESSRNIEVCGDRPCYDIKPEKDEKPKNQNSPIGQFKLGVALDLIQCKPNLELILKASNNHPACVSPKNVQKLIEKGWAFQKEVQDSIFEQISKSEPRRTIENILAPTKVSLSITPDVIDGKRFLIFEGFGWHGFHNVEIIISDNKGIVESVRSQSSHEGDLFMPWPVPDSVMGGMYSIYATDGIHDFEINIPIVTNLTK